MPAMAPGTSEVTTTARRIVTRVILAEWLTTELQKNEECRYCSVPAGALSRLLEEAPDGCNWSVTSVRAAGVSRDVWSPILRKIVAQARTLFNLE